MFGFQPGLAWAGAAPTVCKSLDTMFALNATAQDSTAVW